MLVFFLLPSFFVGRFLCVLLWFRRNQVPSVVGPDGIDWQGHSKRA